MEEELETVRREVFLFEYYNSRDLSVKALTNSRYIIEDRQLSQKVTNTRNFYALFGIRVNKITDYKSFIKTNMSILEEWKLGDYIIEININNIREKIDYFHFDWWSDPDNLSQTSGQENISPEVKDTSVYKKKK